MPATVHSRAMRRKPPERALPALLAALLGLAGSAAVAAGIYTSVPLKDQELTLI